MNGEEMFKPFTKDEALTMAADKIEELQDCMDVKNDESFQLHQSCFLVVDIINKTIDGE